MINIAVLVSGGGTNLQALIDAQQAGKIENGRIALVVSSNPQAYAIERAAQAGIPSAVLRRREYSSAETYSEALDALLQQQEIGLVVLAGFMTVLPDSFCRRYENRIINVHPSLIPSFCGEGYYGLRVHEAALAKGVKVTGATSAGGRWRYAGTFAEACDGRGRMAAAAAGSIGFLRRAPFCAGYMGRQKIKRSEKRYE